MLGLARQEQPSVVEGCQADAEVIINYQVAMEVLVGELHVDGRIYDFFPKCNDTYHVPGQDAAASCLEVVLAVANEGGLRINIDYFIGTAFELSDALFTSDVCRCMALLRLVLPQALACLSILLPVHDLFTC